MKKIQRMVSFSYPICSSSPTFFFFFQFSLIFFFIVYEWIKCLNYIEFMPRGFNSIDFFNAFLRKISRFKSSNQLFFFFNF